MVRYYIRVMRLFEQFPSPSYVIKIAESATSVVSKDDPYTVGVIATCTCTRHSSTFLVTEYMYMYLYKYPQSKQSVHCTHCMHLIVATNVLSQVHYL